MKIGTLMIENFRIFNGSKTFDFKNRDFIVISGPNGNGKSTIFDSIQWCLTGKIPRYEGSTERQRFNFLMNEAVYNQPGEAWMKVEVLLVSDGVTYRISRAQKKSADGSMATPRVQIDGQPLGVKAGEEAIRKILSHAELEETRGGAQEKAMNLATFVSATQLLSQDALNDFIRGDKPGERYKLIDKILGVKKYGEDFVAFVKRTKDTLAEVIEALRQGRQEPNARLATLTALRNQKQHELSDIGEVTDKDLIQKTKEMLEKLKSIVIFEQDSVWTVDQIDDQLIQALVALRKQVNVEQDRYQGIKLKIQWAKELLTLTPGMYSTQKQSILSIQEQIDNKIERRMQGRGVINERRANFEALKVRRISYQATSQQLVQLQSKRIELEQAEAQILSHPTVVDVTSKFSDITVFTKGYKQRQIEQMGIDTYLEYYRVNEVVGRLEKSILNETNLIQSLEEVTIATDQSYQQIIQKLSEIEKASEKQKDSMIEQMIRQVQDHVLKSELEQSCPVCGEEYESPQSLHDSIKGKMEEVDKALSELQKQHLDFSTQKNIAEDQLKILRADIERVKQVCAQYQTQAEQAAVDREKKKTAVPEYLLAISHLELLQKKVDNEKFLSDQKMAYELLSSLDQNEERKEKLQKEEELLLQSIENMTQDSKRWAPYLERDEIEIERKLQGINRYLTKAAEEQTCYEQDKANSLLQLNVLEENWKRRIQKVEEISMDLPGFSGTSEELDNWNLKVEERISALDQYEQQLGMHLTKLQTFLSKDQIAELRNEITTLSKQVDAYDAQIKNYEDFINIDLELLKTRHTSVQSELIGDYLLQHSDFIDQLFMQISPHAVYRHVQLVPKEKDLFIVMTKSSAKENDLRQLSPDELKKKFNASLTFSSAQSNVLAVCIFLALNLSQKWSRLQLLGIDDPFQNLDDINAFSFVDVLSQIVSKQQKQVLISTHSEDFAHLMKMKMGVSPDRIGTIVFQAYSDQGVSVGGNCFA